VQGSGVDETAINAVAAILSEWNPLGSSAENYADLDGYRNEAVNILFELQIRSSRRHAERIVMDVLNQAFDLSLTLEECTAASTRILAILDKTPELP
jgi:hypothetical protein